MGYIRDHDGIPLYENISDVPSSFKLSGRQFGILERNVPSEMKDSPFLKGAFYDDPGHSFGAMALYLGIWIGVIVVIGIVTHVILQDIYLIMTASEYHFESESPDGTRTYISGTGDLVTIGPDGKIIDESHVGGLAWLNQVVVLVVVIIIAILLFYYMRSR